MLTAPAAAKSRRFKRKVRDSLLGYLFLAPALVIFVAFSFYPLYQLFWLATHQKSEVQRQRPARWVGTDQIADTLTSTDFTSGLSHSALFMLFTVPLGLMLGVLLAMAANRRLRGIKIFQTIFSSTVASSVAVASVVFLTLVGTDGYFENVGWLSLSGPYDVTFFGTHLFQLNAPLFTVSLSTVWQNLGLTFIIVLAALQAVPDELVEAATLDGYSAVRRFWRVTVPLISPALLFLAIILVVNSLQAFAQIEILTKGGPGDRTTETLLYKIADPAGERSAGIKASLSLGLFVLTALVAGVQYSLLSKRVHYGE